MSLEENIIESKKQIIEETYTHHLQVGFLIIHWNDNTDKYLVYEIKGDLYGDNFNIHQNKYNSTNEFKMRFPIDPYLHIWLTMGWADPKVYDLKEKKDRLEYYKKQIVRNNNALRTLQAEIVLFEQENKK